MNTINVKSNEVIFRKGDASNSMFFVKSGLIGVYVNYGTKAASEISVIGKGKCFGEMGVIEKSPRSADVVAIDDSVILEIAAEDFPAFVRDNTSDVIKMMENLSERVRATTSDIERASRFINDYVEENKNKDAAHTNVFKGIADMYKKLFSGKKKEDKPKQEYAAGEIVVHQGEIGECMFKILEGSATVFSDYNKESEKELATLKKGDMFGEMAVIDGERRNATIVANEKLSVMTVVNAKLTSYLNANPQEGLKILQSISSKLRGVTAEYVSMLAVIAEYVSKEGAYISNLPNYADFERMASQYNTINTFDGAYMGAFPYNNMFQF